ncbi:hypothetical protein EYR36_001564 [Pleurotus pulmonarius]|nr:hypothetical protein EYR36_001564 [Pleurotus pulmonarius]
MTSRAAHAQPARAPGAHYLSPVNTNTNHNLCLNTGTGMGIGRTSSTSSASDGKDDELVTPNDMGLHTGVGRNGRASPPNEDTFNIPLSHWHWHSQSSEDEGMTTPKPSYSSLSPASPASLYPAYSCFCFPPIDCHAPDIPRLPVRPSSCQRQRGGYPGRAEQVGKRFDEDEQKQSKMERRIRIRMMQDCIEGMREI